MNEKTKRMAPWRLTLIAALGAAIFSLFLLQKLLVAQPDFQVAHHLPEVFDSVRIFALLLAAAFGVLGLLLGRSEDLPETNFRKIVLGGFVLIASVAVFTHPTRSQDIYHSLLLAKGFSQAGLNPYQTTPNDLASDQWALPVLAWRDVPMVYGPLWTLVLAAVTYGVDSLAAALFAVKGLMLIAFGASGFLLWRVLGVHGIPASTRTRLLALVLWSPFVIQTALVDAHNDVFMMLAIVAGYFFLLKRRYALSALVLVAGGFVKYLSWWLVPIPLWYLWRERKSSLGALGVVLGVTAAAVGAGTALWAPFNLLDGALTGALFQVHYTNLRFQLAPGALLTEVFAVSPLALHLIGAFLGSLVGLTGVWLKKPLFAFSAPYLTFFFVGTSWFQPWYVLWVLPLLYISLPIAALTFLSMLLVVMVDVFAPLDLSLAVLFVLGLVGSGYGLRQLAQRFYWFFARTHVAPGGAPGEPPRR